MVLRKSKMVQTNVDNLIKKRIRPKRSCFQRKKEKTIPQEHKHKGLGPSAHKVHE